MSFRPFVVLLCACGPASISLPTATFTFEAVRGRDATPSAAVAASTLEYDAMSRSVKVTISGASRPFNASTMVTQTIGCPGNFGGQPQETRALDAPNLQLGEFLIDAPLLRTDCPSTSNRLVLQSGPLGSSGAPDCSSEVVCLVFRRQ